MDYRRLYIKMSNNRLCTANEDYRRFHEYTREGQVMVDLDPEEETHEDIVQRHLTIFIFHLRALYDDHRDAITKTYEDYVENKKLYEMYPNMFHETFLRHSHHPHNEGRRR